MGKTTTNPTGACIQLLFLTAATLCAGMSAGTATETSVANGGTSHGLHDSTASASTTPIPQDFSNEYFTWLAGSASCSSAALLQTITCHEPLESSPASWQRLGKWINGAAEMLATTSSIAILLQGQEGSHVPPETTRAIVVTAVFLLLLTTLNMLTTCMPAGLSKRLDAGLFGCCTNKDAAATPLVKNDTSNHEAINNNDSNGEQTDLEAQESSSTLKLG